MRIFRLMILLPILLCTTGAFAAPACYQLYGKCNGACLTSGTSDSKNDNFFYKCGGNDGCQKGAAVSISASNSVSKYRLCDGTKWNTIQEDYLDKNARDVRNCIGDGEYAPNRIYTGQEYDFFTEYKTDSILLSDICKKPKTGVGAGNNPKPVEKSKPTTTAEPVAPTEQKHEEPVVIEPVSVQHEEAPAELVDKIAEFVQPGLTEKQSKSSTPASDEKKSEQDKLKSAQDALAAAREKENSWANRGVTAASSAMTGLGGMAAASALAEKRADAEAEKQMRAYIETMKCEYGNGQNVKPGNEEITLPGGNELLDYYTEYKQLADNLKTTKSALGLRSGIESEVLYDRAQSGLYQYASIGKTGGAETSLYRALTDKESEDASAWAEQKEKSAKQLTTGGLVGAGGVGVGLLGDAAINTDMIKNIKEVFKK